MHVYFKQQPLGASLTIILADENKKILSNGSLVSSDVTKMISKADLKLAKDIFTPLYRDEKLGLVVVLNIGKLEKITDKISLNKIGGKVFRLACSYGEEQKINVLAGAFAGFSEELVASEMAFGALLRDYKFDKYFSEKEKSKVTDFNFMTEKADESEKLLQKLLPCIEGINLTRDLVSEVPNVLYPESYSEICKSLTEHGLEVEVLSQAAMKELGMGALLGVAQGSVKEPKMVIMRWLKGNKFDAPMAFIGKGVCFDTGGISLKPSERMEEMKYDMAGSAAVVGLMKAIALAKLPINAIGVVALVENMPDGNAQRPSDIVRSMSGKTIEVLNTDAEGRLILADALWYCQDRYKPKFMVDLATLTGAIVMTLSSVYAGMFSNNDELCEKLLKSSKNTNEKLWNFPMDEEYKEMIKSKAADIQNIGNQRGGGSITAAKFLEEFVNNVPWAHLDIAGVAWKSKGDDLGPEGASGFGVRLLFDLVKNS